MELASSAGRGHFFRMTAMEKIVPKVSPASPLANPEIGDGGVDLSLLEHSLSQTPWERMLANDDAVNFADSLREAMEKRHAKSK